MNKSLFLLTAGYPYGAGEAFLENEIGYLSEAFEKVVIFCPETKSTKKRKVPSNVVVEFYRKQISTAEKISSLVNFFNPVYRREVNYIRNNYSLKVSSKIRLTALISFYIANRIQRQIASIVCQKDSNSKNVFYSFWCDNSAVALAILKNKGVKGTYFSRVHGWDLYFERSEIGYLPFRKFILENLSGIFPVSEKGKLYIENRWTQGRHSNIKVSRLGVKKQSLTIDRPSTFTIVSCSNVIPLKRVHLILDSLKNINEININWFHFGDGPSFKELKSKSLKVPSNINVFLLGNVRNSEIIKWYTKNKVDVFINVSSTEGIPVSIMEAISFGIPVIATNVGGTSEVVKEGVSGNLISANPTIDEIKSKIMENALLSSSERIALKYSTYKFWAENYDAEVNYKHFNEVILRE